MKSIFLLILLSLLTVGMVSCLKEKEVTVNAHFYLSDATQGGPLTLFLKGESKGLLPHPTVPISCSTVGLDSLTLSFPLKSGKYDVSVKNAAGELVHSSDFTIKENSVSANCTKGGGGTSKSGDCFIVDLQTETPIASVVQN